MVFMNARKRNKTLTYVIVAFVSVGLLMSVSLYWTGGSSYSGSTGTGSSTENVANTDFESAMNLISQGKSKEAGEKFAAAISGYEEALKSTPNNYVVMGDLATSYFYTGNTDKAIEIVKKSLAIRPDFSQARLNYAIYLQEGKKNTVAAIQELEKIGKNDTNYSRAQEFISRFKASGLPPQTGVKLPPKQ
jgi:tetratricopeptide (TPR) repeat protein